MALVIAGCGGGSGSSNDSGSGTDTGTGTGTGTGTTDPTKPVQSNLAERIEPYDPLTKSSSVVQVSKSDIAVRGQAAAQSIQKISLTAPGATLKQSTLAAALDPKPGTPVQIGVARDVGQTSTMATMSAQLKWKTSSSGSRIAAVAFDSPSAQGVRLGVLVRQLPVDAVLRFYGAAGGEAVQVTAQELQAQAQQLLDSGADDVTAHTYWSPEFGGAQTILEVEISANADAAQVQFSVPRLSHLTLSVEQLDQAVQAKATAGSCNIDMMCQPDYLNQARSVAYMRFVKSNGVTYQCTGTLLNDAKSSGTPYFLTANHCISTQAEASSLTTDWFYRTTACNSGTASSGVQRLSKGATLLYATSNTDVSFLQLNEAPPSGVVYAGTYYGGALSSGTSVVGIHHPDGDLQKWSQGTVKGFGICDTDDCKSSNSAAAAFYEILWQQGTTEGGSSGSSIFHTIGSQRYVSGQLYAGRASCTTPNGTDFYGRFDVSYQSKLKQWLNP
ncbi:trypsin-like peptidase domain-containing protein [Diaphorobacter sp. HDW4B]|nr:trypsin-like peptidase domain-containing protein [Diaphorobacter sp. HDW4B]